MMMEGAARQMPQAMGQMGSMMGHPMTQGAMMAATGYAAGRGLFGTLVLRNPLVLLAAGVAAGYLAFKYEKEILEGLSKLTGMGKDFALEQKESLADLVAEAQEQRTPGGPAAAQPPADN